MKGWEWINSSHYHCKQCGASIKCVGAFSWDIGHVFEKAGVRRIGFCDCGQILIEHERNELKWISAFKRR